MTRLAGVQDPLTGKISEAYKPIDLSNDPELLKLAEEVHTTHEPDILRRDDEDSAVLIPLTPKRKRKGKTEKEQSSF